MPQCIISLKELNEKSVVVKVVADSTQPNSIALYCIRHRGFLDRLNGCPVTRHAGEFEFALIPSDQLERIKSLSDLSVNDVAEFHWQKSNFEFSQTYSDPKLSRELAGEGHTQAQFYLGHMLFRERFIRDLTITEDRYDFWYKNALSQIDIEDAIDLTNWPKRLFISKVLPNKDFLAFITEHHLLTIDPNS